MNYLVVEYLVSKAAYGVHEVGQGLHVVSRTPGRLGARLGQQKMYSEPFAGEGGRIKGYHVDRAKRGLNERRRAIKRGEVRPETTPAPIRNWMTGH